MDRIKMCCNVYFKIATTKANHSPSSTPSICPISTAAPRHPSYRRKKMSPRPECRISRPQSKSKPLSFHCPPRKPLAASARHCSHHSSSSSSLNSALMATTRRTASLLSLSLALPSSAPTVVKFDISLPTISGFVTLFAGLRSPPP